MYYNPNKNPKGYIQMLEEEITKTKEVKPKMNGLPAIIEFVEDSQDEVEIRRLRAEQSMKKQTEISHMILKMLGFINQADTEYQAKLCEKVVEALNVLSINIETTLAEDDEEE